MSAVGYCFDIGNATRDALGVYSDALSNDKEVRLAGSDEPSASGDGSLMRLAPIPVFYHKTPSEALAMSDLQSKITHASQMCLESCRLATAQMLGFFGCPEISTIEERKQVVLDPMYLPDGIKAEELSFVSEEVGSLRAGTWKTKSAKEIRTSGFVIHSHEAGLWALRNSRSFEEGMLSLLPLGSDVDTVCTIYGQLAGALFGIQAIPERWRNTLQWKDILGKVFDTLVEKAALPSPC